MKIRLLILIFTYLILKNMYIFIFNVNKINVCVTSKELKKISNTLYNIFYFIYYNILIIHNVYIILILNFR